jgi:hypothetical protein
MRSFMLALAFAAPVCAVAATPNYTNPIHALHSQQNQKDQLVFLTFVNYTPQDREVRIGNIQYRARYNTVLHVYAPVGSVVRVFSDQNTKVNGQELMTVSAADRDKSILLK